jgi:hypothetical protein
MDRNTIIGFTLLAAMLIAYFTYNNYTQQQFEQKKRADSIAYAKAHPPAPIDSARIKAVTAADTFSVATGLPRHRAKNSHREQGYSHYLLYARRPPGGRPP